MRLTLNERAGGLTLDGVTVRILIGGKVTTVPRKREKLGASGATPGGVRENGRSWRCVGGGADPVPAASWSGLSLAVRDEELGGGAAMDRYLAR